MSTSAGPLLLPRLVAYTLLISISICVIGTSAWALADLNDKEDQLKDVFSQGELDASDNVACSSVAVAFAAGAIFTTFCYILFAAIPKFRKCDVTQKSLKAHAWYYGFLDLAWLAIGIASAVIVATRSADITVPGVPQGLIDQALKSSGESTAYKDNNPSVAYVICIWLAFLITSMVLVLEVAAVRAAASPAVGDRENMHPERVNEVKG